MLSIETQARVARIFTVLAEGERTVEVSRQVLSDNYDFDAYQIFKFLDTECKNKICPYNLITYLQSKGTYISNCEAEMIILYYDQDYDGLLSYPEFLGLVQSEKSIKKNGYSNLNGTQGIQLSYNVDYSLTKLLEKETTLARNVISLLTELRTRCDFNIHEIYHAIKNSCVVSSDDIRSFMERNSTNYLESDIRSILKRLDFNKDGKIDLCEFHAFFGFPQCKFCCIKTACSCCGICCCGSCICDVPCFVHHCVHSIHSPCASPCHSPIRTCISHSPCASPKVSSYGVDKPGNALGNPPLNSDLNSTLYKTYTNLGRENSIMNREPRANTVLNNNYSTYNNNYNTYSPNRNNYSQNKPSSPEVKKITNTLSLRLSPERRFSPDKTCLKCCCYPCRCCHTCLSFPCVCHCCSICHFTPCRCCHTCFHFPCTCLCCNICHFRPCRCCTVCHYLPCRCCKTCHCSPCTCLVHHSPCHSPIHHHSPCHSIHHSPCHSPYRTSSIIANAPLQTSPIRNANSPNISNARVGLVTSQSISTSNNLRNIGLKPSMDMVPNIQNLRPTVPYNPNEYEEGLFVQFLQSLMRKESQLEKMKIDLALRSDFNCEDAFRIFELDGRGFLTKDDLQYGLTLLGIAPSSMDLNLLIKRFDLRKTGVINYADFFDMIVPFERDYRLMVESRPPNSCCPCRSIEIISFVTRNYLRNVLSLIIQIENEINNLRKGFATLRLKINEIFSLIDYGRLGFFCNEEFMRFLKSKGIYEDQKDADLAFIRLDRNRNGKIELWEVNDELEPAF